MFTRAFIRHGVLAFFAAPLFVFAACAVDSPTAQIGAPTKGEKDGHSGVPEGYSLQLVAGGLEFPTAVAFCAQDDMAPRLFVAESGVVNQTPRIREIAQDGTMGNLLESSELAAGVLLPPLTDITMDHDLLWLAHRQIGANGWHVGAISVLDPMAPVETFRTVLTNLPAAGDHSVNEVVMGRDGLVYISIGSATNSAVVGPDNALVTGWLGMFPNFHDFTPVDVRLSGVSYTTENVLTEEAGDTAVTSPYMPYGSGAMPEGTLISAVTPENPMEGMIAANSAVYRFDPMADDPTTTLELVAWGLRNPFGLAFDRDNEDLLYITNNGADVRGVGGEVNEPGEPGEPGDPGGGYTPMKDDRDDGAGGKKDDDRDRDDGAGGKKDDDRDRDDGAGGKDGGDDGGDGLQQLGSRPITNDYDDLFVVDVNECGAFFGFPDYAHDPQSGAALPITDPLFCTPEQSGVEIACPQFVLNDETRNMLFVSEALAQFENHSSANKLDIAPTTDWAQNGDLFVAETGSFVPITGATEFVGYKVVVVDRETGRVTDFITAGNTQEEIFDPEGLNKPIDVKFRDEQMLIVDFGVFEPGIGLSQPGTGKLWMLTRDDADMELPEDEGGEQPETPDVPETPY